MLCTLVAPRLERSCRCGEFAGVVGVSLSLMGRSMRVWLAMDVGVLLAHVAGADDDRYPSSQIRTTCDSRITTMTMTPVDSILPR